MLTMISQRFLLDHAGGRLPDHKVQMSIKPVDGMPMRVRARQTPGIAQSARPEAVGLP